MFLGDLFGLVLAEVSFETDEELDDFRQPPFAIAEVTNDPVFSGGSLAELTFAEVKKHMLETGLITQQR
jgi:CYTH domain-containing protein